MRIRIDHLTCYEYSQPPRSVIQLLRLTPASNGQQNVMSWRIDVDCDARLTPFTDAHGNQCHIMTIDHPVDKVRIETIGEVDTLPSNGVVTGTVEPLPHLVYLQPTDLTTPDRDIITYAHDVAAAKSNNPLYQLHMLLSGIRRDISFETGATSAETDAATAFSKRRGVCQDLAHIFIAAARALHIPARYVSGHLLRHDEVEWQEAAHAWAEAYVRGLGWVSFDPANGICADEHYVRVATGLDYRDAAPVVGARYGGGQETMSVGLRVRQSLLQPQE